MSAPGYLEFERAAAAAALSKETFVLKRKHTWTFYYHDMFRLIYWFITIQDIVIVTFLCGNCLEKSKVVWFIQLFKFFRASTSDDSRRLDAFVEREFLVCKNHARRATHVKSICRDHVWRQKQNFCWRTISNLNKEWNFVKSFQMRRWDRHCKVVFEWVWCSFRGKRPENGRHLESLLSLIKRNDQIRQKPKEGVFIRIPVHLPHPWRTHRSRNTPAHSTLRCRAAVKFQFWRDLRSTV